MKKLSLLLLFIALLFSETNAQVYPFYDDYESYTAFNVPTGYVGNITVYLTHGTAASKGLAGFLTSFSNSDSIFFPAIGPVSANSSIEFDWRMMDPFLYPSSSATLAPGDNFDILISTDGFVYSSIFNINSSNYISTTNFAHESISLNPYAGSIIFFKILGRRANGSAEFFIDVDNVIVDDPSSTQENELNGLLIYPTVASGEISFSNPVPLNGLIQIIDVTGKVVKEINVNHVLKGEVDLSGITSGNYRMKVKTNSSNKITPFIIR